LIRTLVRRGFEAGQGGALDQSRVVSQDPIVSLHLESRPQTLTIVRGMLGGLAEVLAIDPELLDDLKTAVSEACNNVVLHAYAGDPGPMRVLMFAEPGRLRVSVQDDGVGLSSVATGPEENHGIGVSVIRALTENASFASPDGGGTTVQMDFAGRRDGHELFRAPAAAAPEQTVGPIQPGEVVVTLSPVDLFAPVLGRLARTLAATAHFSLDRFSDVYLVTDTIAAHASGASASSRIGARMMASERRLELVVGPFRLGTGAMLQAGATERPSPLALLSDEVSVERAGETELVHVVVIDHRR
jgi:serine/threonine-protein kinase RsbW